VFSVKSGRRVLAVGAMSGGMVFLGGSGVASGLNEPWTVSAQRRALPTLALRLAGAVDPAWNGWIRAGDVLRLRLTLSGSMRRARVALAAVPPSASLSVACPRTASASPAGQECDLGRVRGGTEMEVQVTVPPGAQQVTVTAVAHIRRPADSRARWLSRSAAVIVGTRLADLDAPSEPYAAVTSTGEAPLGPPLAPAPASSDRPGGLTERGVLPAMPPPLRRVQDS
jgi:hypothetical protein